MTSGQGIPIGDLRILHSGSSPLRWAGLLTPVFTLLTRDRRQGWAVCGASACVMEDVAVYVVLGGGPVWGSA
jgi:hypothetical protein